LQHNRVASTQPPTKRTTTVEVQRRQEEREREREKEREREREREEAKGARTWLYTIQGTGERRSILMDALRLIAESLR